MLSLSSSGGKTPNMRFKLKNGAQHMTNAKKTKPNTFVAFCSFLTWRLEPRVLNINGCVLRELDFFLQLIVSDLFDKLLDRLRVLQSKDISVRYAWRQAWHQWHRCDIPGIHATHLVLVHWAFVGHVLQAGRSGAIHRWSRTRAYRPIHQIVIFGYRIKSFDDQNRM